MFEKWFRNKNNKAERIHLKVEKDERLKILDLLEEEKEEKLSNDLLNGLSKFRDKTHSLDYIREEIEKVMGEKNGEEKIMKGFSKSFDS